jgi:hypothetical protein
MTPPIRELPRTDLPPVLVYVTALVCGLIAAMVVETLLSHSGIALAEVWRDLLSANSLQKRSAGAWWLVAGSAFLVGALTGGALSRMPLPWTELRPLRWVLGAALVFGLAEAGHIAGEVAIHGAAGAHAAVTLLSLCAVALMALFGAYFAAKR